MSDLVKRLRECKVSALCDEAADVLERTRENKRTLKEENERLKAENERLQELSDIECDSRDQHIDSLQKQNMSLQAGNERLEWQLNFVAGKDAGLANAAAWAWRKHQESGEAS